MAPPPVDPAMIDNFEDMNSALLPSAGRAGTWLAANDGTSTQTLAAEAGGANGSAAALHSAGSGFSDWGAAGGEYFHLEIVKDPGGNWRVNHSGTHFAADGVDESLRPNLSSTGDHDTGVPIGEALALNWWLDGTTLHFEAGNTHLSHTDERFITGVPAFFSGRGAWSDGTPTSYQILGIATPPGSCPPAKPMICEDTISASPLISIALPIPSPLPCFRPYSARARL